MVLAELRRDRCRPSSARRSGGGGSPPPWPRRSSSTEAPAEAMLPRKLPRPRGVGRGGSAGRPRRGLHDVMQGRAGDPEAVAQTQPEQDVLGLRRNDSADPWACRAPSTRTASARRTGAPASPPREPGPHHPSSGPCMAGPASRAPSRRPSSPARPSIDSRGPETAASSIDVGAPACGRLRWRAWPTPRNLHPRSPQAGRGRRAGDPRGRPVPRGALVTLTGSPLRSSMGRDPTRRRSTPGPGHTGTRRRKSPTQSPQRADRKVSHESPGERAGKLSPRSGACAGLAAHRSVADPRKALVATQGLRLSGVPHGRGLYRHPSPRRTFRPLVFAPCVTTRGAEICGSGRPSNTPWS